MSLNKIKIISIIMLVLLAMPSVSATVTEIIVSADTTAYRGSTPATQLNTIMGHDIDVGVWNYYNDISQGKYGYIKFANISGIGSPNIPSNSIINSATMWLYTRAGESQTITFYTPSGPWDENTLNWNNKPSYVTPYASVAQDGSTAHWTSVDVTNIVREWNDGTTPNNGLVAVSDGGGGSASTDWSSKESPTNKPYISVDYTAPSTPKPTPPPIVTPTGINIISPKNSETISWSPEGYTVKGTLSGIPSSYKPYILVHPITTDKYWIQITPTISGSNWETVVYLGTKDAGANENYEIYAIITDKTFKDGAELAALPSYSSMARVTVFRPVQGAPPVTTAPTESSEPSNSYIYAGIAGIIILLIAVVFLKRRDSPKEKTAKVGTIVKPEPIIRKPEPESPEKQPVSTAQTKGIIVTSAYGYKGATIQYKVKVENPTNEPVADIKISLFVPDVFLISESTQNIAMLKSSESKTATFEIRPTGECGTCEVSGKVVYYDYTIRKTSEADIPAKNLSIVCPMLQSKEITEDTWRSLVSKLVKAEESTKEIDMPAITLFDVISDIMRDMNLYMLEPKRTDSSGLYRATARFYGEGVKGLRYASQAEVIGGPKKSKLIIRAWAEKEDALVGFYHGIWDVIEKRVQVKQYIDTPIIQQFYHYGTRIGTQVTESVVQHSTIGAGARKCPDCGKEVKANATFCPECRARL